MNTIFSRANRVGRRIVRSAQFPMDRWLINLSAVRHPGNTRKTFIRAVAGARQAVLFYSEGLEGSIQVWEGEEISSGRPFRVAYLGEERAIRFNSPLYLQHLLFRPDTAVKTTKLQNFPMIDIGRQTHKLAQDSDLLIVEGNSLLPVRPSTGQWAITPTWIRMEFIFEPGETWEDVKKRFRAHKNNVKRVRQNGFHFRISQAEEDFDLFYDHMYVPLLQQRYGEYGAIDLKESMRERFHQGFLFVIEDPDDRPIAAQLVQVHRKTLYSLSSGILNGNPELHSKGALSAIYYFSILWCFEHAMERFEMGGVRPFQTDGLYQYKRRWGMTPTPDFWGSRKYLFWAPHNARVAVDWLNEHPVVSLSEFWQGKPVNEPVMSEVQ